MAANFPRSVFLNRAAFPLVATSRRIAEYKVRSGVVRPGAFQSPLAAIAPTISLVVIGVLASASRLAAAGGPGYRPRLPGRRSRGRLYTINLSSLATRIVHTAGCDLPRTRRGALYDQRAPRIDHAASIAHLPPIHTPAHFPRRGGENSSPGLLKLSAPSCSVRVFPRNIRTSTRFSLRVNLADRSAAPHGALDEHEPLTTKKSPCPDPSHFDADRPQVAPRKIRALLPGRAHPALGIHRSTRGDAQANPRILHQKTGAPVRRSRMQKGQQRSAVSDQQSARKKVAAPWRVPPRRRRIRIPRTTSLQPHASASPFPIRISPFPFPLSVSPDPNAHADSNDSSGNSESDGCTAADDSCESRI